MHLVMSQSISCRYWIASLYLHLLLMSALRVQVLLNTLNLGCFFKLSFLNCSGDLGFSVDQVHMVLHRRKVSMIL